MAWGNTNIDNRKFTTVNLGGTGRNELTEGSYLVGNGTKEVELKTPEEVRNDIGAAPAYTYGAIELTTGESELTAGTLYFVYEE